MLFNSLTFAVFLPVVFILYWILLRGPLRAQNICMLAASFVFYGWWDWRFLFLIIFSSTVDYVTGIAMFQSVHPTRRKFLLAISLVANLGVLGFFKYYDFFLSSFTELLGAIGLQASPHTLNIILPVGISFYTFQTLSYTIDIYRKKLKPTTDVFAFFAFVSFFPQLVAGPIERASNLLPQFLNRRQFDPVKAHDGLRQMLNGFIKKMVIADNLAPLVDDIFTNYAQLDGVTLFIGVFFFAIQIYCDFSGYSDIAIGCARLFGFDLMQNFAYPYFARNIGEFWRRWHISLSTWFRDYVYIPMGGNRGTKGRQTWNTMVTFTVSGLWHGANWTFVAWGFLNGLYLLPLIWANRNQKNLEAPSAGRLLPSFSEAGAIFVTFMVTLLAWVFFRAPSIDLAFDYLGTMARTPFSGSDYSAYYPMILACYILLALEWLQKEKRFMFQIDSLPVAARWFLYCIGVCTILVFGAFGSTEFIYFQF